MNAAWAPIALVLFKLSLLFAGGWAAHALLRRRHPRWRVILWRALLCGSLLLPLTVALPHPRISMPIYPEALMLSEPVTVPTAARDAAQSGSRAVSSRAISHPQGLPLQASEANLRADSSHFGSTHAIIRYVIGCWLLITLMLAARLIWLQRRLRLLIRGAREADPELVKQLRSMQQNLGVKRGIQLRVSDTVHSPFAAGFSQPVIMLPAKLLATLTGDELAMLLAHEVAHFRRSDLVWCFAWRWAQVLLWFHPLVWKIPAAHNLACEQEADLLASGRLADGQRYATLLAGLTLRVLALPDVETRLVMNGAAQITHRLDHLARICKVVWTWKHTVAGLLLAFGLFLVASGCEVTSKGDETVAMPSTNAWGSAEISVMDEAGQPIEGAVIRPFGFRVAGPRHVDGHGWMTNRFGPVPTVLTDRDGKASIKYPLVAFPDEKLITDALTFTIRHPDYSTVTCQDYPVDGTGEPFHLKRGMVLEVSAYYGPQHQAVTDLVPSLGEEGARKEDWRADETGVYSYGGLTAGGHLLQLMGRLSSGEIVFSDSIVVTAEPGKTNRVDLEMKPGIRIEGRLDSRVPRPVKNGRVIIAVRPRQFPAYLVPEDVNQLWHDYGYFRFWRSYRTIAEDGTFIFESVPPGEVDVIVQGDGFCSQSIGEVRNRINGQLSSNSQHICIPQPFALTAPVTTIEVKTEPTATLNLTVQTKSGTHLEGAQVHLSPNVLRIGGIFGWLKESSEKPYRALPPLPDLPYSAKTDAAGVAVVSNLPPESHNLGVNHPGYVVPLKDKGDLPNRQVLAEFAAGQTTTVNVVMEPAGKDYIGTAK